MFFEKGRHILIAGVVYAIAKKGHGRTSFLGVFQISAVAVGSGDNPLCVDHFRNNLL